MSDSKDRINMLRSEEVLGYSLCFHLAPLCQRTYSGLLPFVFSVPGRAGRGVFGRKREDK
jgi:hypothetical protein